MLTINGEHISTGLTLTNNTWHFICVTWMSTDGYYEVYLDGYLKSFGKNLSLGGHIEANGSLVVGQVRLQLLC